MIEYKNILDEKKIEVLRKIIGQNILGIYCNMIDVDVFHNRYISYWGFNIRFGDTEFIIIKNYWKETKSYIDYWEMDVEFSNEPDNITFDKGKNVIRNAPVSFNIFQKVVSSIEIYSYTVMEFLNNGESETITYDKAIVLNFNDDKRMCFAPVNSIADAVWFTLDEIEIANYLKESTLRLKVLA